MDKSTTKADGGGLRNDADKNRIELVPPEWPWALADVTTQGSKKYPERNWERGMKHSKMIGCAFRHIFKYLCGERYDGDKFDLEAGTTGCHHLAMAAWNLLGLMSYDLRGIGENDLPKTNMSILARVNAAGAEKPNEKHPLDEYHELARRVGFDPVQLHSDNCAKNQKLFGLGICGCPWDIEPPGPPDSPDPKLANSRVG